MKFNHAIIDSDPLIYRCGFAIQSFDKETDMTIVEPVHHGYYNLNSMINNILERTKADTYSTYLTASGRGNFRFEIFPDYKANRKDAPRPVYFNELREFMQKRWNAVVVEGQEADDSCSIEHCEKNPLGFDYDIKNSIVCSIDKDFNNIPGWHYNYVKDEIYYITEVESLRNFYLQILTGDISDGIPRIKKGWREKEIKASLQKVFSECEMYEIVLKEIEKLRKTDCLVTDDLMGNEDILISRGRLVWLRRYEGELWQPTFNEFSTSMDF